MQPQEQITVAASTAFSWIGTEFLSLLQLLFFLTLGYAVTRTWIWTRSRTSKQALAKKVDDVDNKVPDESQGSESDVTPASKKSNTRHSNTHERKKNKKAKEVDDEKLRNELDLPLAAPAPESVQVTLEDQPQEQVPEALPEVTAQPQPEAPQESEAQKARVAKMMAKKMERKAKKAQEKTEPEEKSIPVAGGKTEKPDIVAPVEGKSDAEASSADDMAQTPSTPSMVAAPVVLPHEEPVSSAREQMSKPMQNVYSLQSMETDAQSDSDDVCLQSSDPEGISTPEPGSPRGVSSPMWCGMAQAPQIEGWMAVAVPTEFAPPGAPGPFDGLWKNGEDERIVIDHQRIHFENGMEWTMHMLSLTNLSVQVGEEEFTAELDVANQLLRWSDGDDWKCVGQTDSQQQWAAAREQEGLPCFYVEGEQFMQMNPMAMNVPMELPMEAPQMIPEDAKTWEICWDWSKKGWCKKFEKGSCDWYHPAPSPPQFQHCAPCESAAPFSEYDMPFAGGF